MDMKSIYLNLASAPALVMFRGSPEERARQGTILFYHGFGESKDTYVSLLQRFAEAGFLSAGIDGIGHGERRYLDFDERFPPQTPHLAGNMQLEAAFLAVVRATAQEVPVIVDALIEREWAHEDRIGISGHSFGGFVTYVAVLEDQRIRAAAPVLGSPEWKLPWPECPHRHVEHFFPTALLSQTSGKDTKVLPDFARAFHHRLAPYYAQAPERLCYIEHVNSAHDLTEEDWDQAWKNVVRWFEIFLARESHLGGSPA